MSDIQARCLASWRGHLEKPSHRHPEEEAEDRLKIPLFSHPSTERRWDRKSLTPLNILVRKWKGRLLNANLAKLRGELEASRDYLFKAANVTQDLFRN